MAEIRRCQICGGLVALIDPTPHIISLNRAWVHITRFGSTDRGTHGKWIGLYAWTGGDR